MLTNLLPGQRLAVACSPGNISIKVPAAVNAPVAMAVCLRKVRLGFFIGVHLFFGLRFAPQLAFPLPDAFAFYPFIEKAQVGKGIVGRLGKQQQAARKGKGEKQRVHRDMVRLVRRQEKV